MRFITFFKFKSDQIPEIFRLEKNKTLSKHLLSKLAQSGKNNIDNYPLLFAEFHYHNLTNKL